MRVVLAEDDLLLREGLALLLERSAFDVVGRPVMAENFSLSSAIQGPTW